MATLLRGGPRVEGDWTTIAQFQPRTVAVERLPQGEKRKRLRVKTAGPEAFVAAAGPADHEGRAPAPPLAQAVA